jgi:alkaline phosphatase/streptomycin-6-phosphatase
MKGKRLLVAVAAMLALVAVGAASAAATGFFSHHHQDRTERAVAAALLDRHPRNVIFLLGDGMGTQEITAARYYQGVNNDLNVDRMPFTGFDTTWSVKPAAAPPYLPDYDPDSASTGTAWATGQKTIDERISQGPSSAENVPGKNLKTVLELAQKEGKKVGDVSTAEITDATRPCSPRTSRCAAARARATWLSATPRKRRKAASARSLSRRSTTGSTCSSAAGAPASNRKSRAVRSPANR